MNTAETDVDATNMGHVAYQTGAFLYFNGNGNAL